MTRLIDRVFGHMPGWQLALWCSVLVGCFALADRVTGDELSFAIFYLLPVALAAWYGTAVTTFGVAMLAAFGWFAVEYASDRDYSQQWILFWNAGVRMLFFCIVAVLMRRLRLHVETQQQLARTDPLTGLLNRTGFLERSEALVNSAARYRLPLVIGFIDLDGFKKVNDTLGHHQGDELLRVVGAALRRATRDSDIAGRLGGDEFAIVLPNTRLDGAGAYFAKLHRELLRDMRRVGLPETGVSIGAMAFEDGPPRLPDALKMADELMYRAKRSGGMGVLVEAPAPPVPLRSVSGGR